VALDAYVPQDRLRALARGQVLPDRTRGSALLADISGFTALTESLRDALGPRQGAEELTHHLGRVYSAVIAEVEKFDGSVISFAGDAVTCWFDGADAALRAVTCAFGLQAAVRAFSAITLPDGSTRSLSLKVCVATGDARRFVVGDPDINYIDALAGATVARTSTGERLAGKGEILVDEATERTLRDCVSTTEWRTAEGREKFAVALALGRRASIVPRSSVPHLEGARLKAWIDKSVYERERSGQASFLTEFRPGAVLFVSFTGIDYDAGDAPSRLDAFVRRLQAIAARHGGTVLQLNIGDKGSYAYVNFGALSAHEDDPRRTVATALDLVDGADLQLRIGIAQGVMRVGAYGGPTRRTYGALGDEVNVAARLMTAAGVGEILVSDTVHKAVKRHFAAEPRPALLAKGKAEPLCVFAVIGRQRHRAIRLQEPSYGLPMVGRVRELDAVNARLDLAAEGRGQVIGIVAEAGMGKSRLVAEVVRSARRKGFAGYGGACQSDAVNTPYQAWKSIWQAFFETDPERSSAEQMRLLQGEIGDRAPTRIDAVPLLNVVLDLQMPDNDFTAHLEPKIRQSALHALLEESLKAASKDEPILVVIEDLHWIDALSLELLEQLANALAGHAVAFVLAYRPSQWGSNVSRLESLPQFTRIALSELTLPEAREAIRAKLAQLYPARDGTVPEGLVEALMARAQGNPFYIEELLNYVRDRGLDPSALRHLELPDSLHALILSRIDQLSESDKVTLRVASVIGRLFRAEWLTGCYPELGALPAVRAALDQLSNLDITPLDSPEPERRYLFKHIVTHEVTYESLPFATRARLHEQLARYLEGIEAPVEAIAFHYSRTGNTAKKIEFLRKAGDLAQRNFANDAALGHFASLLALLEDDKEKFRVHLMRGQVAELMGRYADAENDYGAALALAGDDLPAKAAAQYALGKLNRLRGEYASALEWLGQARELRTRLGDVQGLSQGLLEKGAVLNRTGDLAQARAALNEGLALAREVADKRGVALALNMLGNVAWSQGEYEAARTRFAEGMTLRREIGDPSDIAASLNNLGIVTLVQDDFPSARAYFEESLSIRRAIGEKSGVASSLTNLGVMAMWQGDDDVARASYEEALAMMRDVGDKLGIGLAIFNLGNVALAQGEYANARTLNEEGLALYREIGAKSGIANCLCSLGVAAWAQGDQPAARVLLEESLGLWQGLDNKSYEAMALIGLGLVDMAEGRVEARERMLGSLRLVSGELRMEASCLVAMAALALHRGTPRFAAQLLGAVRSALAPLGLVVEPIVKFFHIRTLANVEAALGETVFRSSLEEGGRWPLVEAIERVSQQQA
jgi:class 3 adenylate cyclase/tetratricopeptide (TPR) repeat protein